MDRIDKGEAQAVLEAFGGGGWAVLRHSKVANGAPADQVGSHGAIRPFAPWDGLHLCAQDWHVVLVADIEGGDASFTEQDAEALITPLAITFQVDGAPLPTTRTAVKRFLNPAAFGLVEAYYVQQGTLLAPGDLAPGRHRVSCTMTFQGKVVFDNTVRVIVDPPGGGACA